MVSNSRAFAALLFFLFVSCFHINAFNIFVSTRQPTMLMTFQGPLFGRSTAVKTVVSDILLRRQFIQTTTAMLATTPGQSDVQLDSPSKIQEALRNPRTTLIDVRGLDEIKSNGTFNPPTAQQNQLRWISAPCSLQECPLLEVCSDVMIRDRSSPIIVYCASGKRADRAKQLLKHQGYQHVYNAGGHPNDTKQYE